MAAVANSRPIEADITVPIRRALNVDIIDTMRTYLAKPRIVGSTLWTPASTLGSGLFSPFKSFASTATDQAFLDKLTGFTGIRYTTNIRVVINASPFQAGKLRLVYYPNGGNTKTKYNAHVSNRLSLSQMPGVEMTTMEQSMEVSVPFLSYQEYYDMTGDRVDPLYYNVHVFSPLTNGASATKTNVGVTVWVWFTDVELYGASTIEPQSRVAKKVTVRTVAAEEEKPLSTWLSATSKLAGSLSSVPIISSIAAPTAVWAKYASGVASAFGYARPINGEPVRPMAPHYNASISNADGLNVSAVMAMNKDASSRLLTDYSPKGQDEMSLNFIKRQWSYFREFTFPSTAVAGDQLLEQELGLNMGASATTPYGVATTPIEFLGRLFPYYRGGVEICFKFVKTGFHSGSLAFSYAIGTSATPITLAKSDRLHRTIVDIQDGDSVCLSFPFMSNREFLRSNFYYGRLYAHVINPMVAPETVAQSIVVQMYIRGMEDLEFSGLNTSSQYTAQQIVPIQNEGMFGKVQREGGALEEDDEIVCEPIGGLLVEPTITGLPMMDSMSETVTSLLQFLKNGVNLGFPLSTPASYGFRTWAFNPATWNVRGVNGSGTFTTYPSYADSAWSMIRACYAFQHGGYEINIIPTVYSTPNTGLDNSVNHHQVAVDYISNTGTSLNFENAPDINIMSLLDTDNQNTHVALTKVKGQTASNHGRHGISATLPYKSLYRVNLIRPSVTGTSSDDSYFLARFLIAGNSTDRVLMRPAEDYQLLYWVGVPPLSSYVPT